MTKKKEYTVMVGFKNAWGDVVDQAVIAKFYSENRAQNYLRFCMDEQSDDCVVYWIA